MKKIFTGHEYHEIKMEELTGYVKFYVEKLLHEEKNGIDVSSEPNFMKIDNKQEKLVIWIKITHFNILINLYREDKVKKTKKTCFFQIFK